MFLKSIIKILGILVIGALGAWIFEYFVFPYVSPQRNVVVNQTQQVYVTENTALENAIKNAENSIVAIQKNGTLAGAGLVATSDGSVITLASLVPAGAKIDIFLDGESVSYQIEKRDPKNNLVLIKIDKNNLETVGFADANKIVLGQRVFFTGPQTVKGDSWFADEGVVRSFDQSFVKTNISEKSIASGTPLFNVLGELVGLNFIDQDGKISAIPVNTIKSFLGI